MEKLREKVPIIVQNQVIEFYKIISAKGLNYRINLE